MIILFATNAKALLVRTECWQTGHTAERWNHRWKLDCPIYKKGCVGGWARTDMQRLWDPVLAIFPGPPIILHIHRQADIWQASKI